MARPNESINETENWIRENVETSEENTCPDGGWGWVIAVAACATRIIKEAVNISFGILFSGILIQIGASSSTVGWIFNICLTMTDVSKFFAGPLGDVIGWRQVSISAGLCCSLCTFALMFASSVTYMIIFFSFGLDWQKFNNKLGLSVGLAGLCISLFGFTFAFSRLWVIVLASFAGLFNGLFISQISIVMVNSLGMKLFKASYGISGIFVAASSLVIGPLLGLIRDLSGSYDLSMRLSAGLILISLALIILLPIAVKLDKEKTELQLTNVSDINAL